MTVGVRFELVPFCKKEYKDTHLDMHGSDVKPNLVHFLVRYSLRSIYSFGRSATSMGFISNPSNPMPNDKVSSASLSFFPYNLFDRNPGMGYSNYSLSGSPGSPLVHTLDMSCISGVFSLVHVASRIQQLVFGLTGPSGEQWWHRICYWWILLNLKAQDDG